MIVVVSGEGPTDIGTTDQAGEFQAGPMSALIDRLIEPVWKVPPLKTGCFAFISKHQLNKRSKASISPALRGKKRKEFETAFFFKNARALARYASELEAEQKDCSMAVLFADADGTRSTKKSERSAKVRSMLDGFAVEDFQHGVPMIPKPKSEVWLMCALQDAPYQNCDRLERLPGNDNAQNPPKAQLKRLLAKRKIRDVHDTVGMIVDGNIDAHLINMPSYNEFKKRLNSVALKMLKG